METILEVMLVLVLEVEVRVADFSRVDAGAVRAASGGFAASTSPQLHCPLYPSSSTVQTLAMVQAENYSALHCIECRTFP